MSVIGWDNDYKQFRLSHQPGVTDLICGGWQYDKRNFTVLTNILHGIELNLLHLMHQNMHKKGHDTCLNFKQGLTHLFHDFLQDRCYPSKIPCFLQALFHNILVILGGILTQNGVAIYLKI